MSPLRKRTNSDNQLFFTPPLFRETVDYQSIKKIHFERFLIKILFGVDSKFENDTFMILKNFDYAIKYFDYESKTEIEKTSNTLINGWYKFIDGLLSALLVIDDNLYFLYGEDKFLITESNRVVIKGKSNVKNEFSLFNKKDLLVRFDYSIPDSNLNVSPFEYIDEDDFKWGEFMTKIINDKERKRNFVMNLMECR